MGFTTRGAVLSVGTVDGIWRIYLITYVNGWAVPLMTELKSLVSISLG